MHYDHLSDLQAKMKIEHERIMTRMTEQTHNAHTYMHALTHIDTHSLSLSLRKRIMHHIADR